MGILEIFNVKPNENFLKSLLSPFSQQISFSVAIILLIYCVFVALSQLVTKIMKENQFCCSTPLAFDTSVGPMDLSMLFKCFPCTTCSIRHAMRSCCNTNVQGSLRKFVTCECARTTVYGNTQNIDLVCCSI